MDFIRLLLVPRTPQAETAFRLDVAQPWRMILPKGLDFVLQLDDRAAVMWNFERVVDRPPDPTHPITFKEKVVYKILHDQRPTLTGLADKLRGRATTSAKGSARIGRLAEPARPFRHQGEARKRYVRPGPEQAAGQRGSRLRTA